MLKPKSFLLLFLVVISLAGCQFISNTLEYKKSSKEFVETIISEDYDKAIEMMAMEHETAEGSDPETIKAGLANFRKVIVDNWGTELDYSFMKAEKNFSTSDPKYTAPNTTRVELEIKNDKEFGILDILYDDTSQKILNIQTQQIKGPVPNMLYFWLFGILAMCVPIFNIYVIRKIKKSDLKRKWLKYLAVICLNIPAISYVLLQGIQIDYLSFQILLGIGFGFMGLINTYWTFGFPLGGIYWLWKLKKKEKSVQIEAEL